MTMQSLANRLQKLEAVQTEEDKQPVHIVTYGIEYGDDVKAKRAEADAEFRRKNPDWEGPLDGTGGQICLIELVSVAAENGAPKHPDWQPYRDALKDPDRPENASIIAAYEAMHRHAWQSVTA
jgi:hypothetical protein